MSEISSIFEVANLSKSFGGLRAVSELSFSVQEKMITSLIGPNGAGKTTVFALVTGFLKPDLGKVLFRGHNITGLPSFQIANLGIARTFQDVRILDKLTVRDNIFVGLPETHQQGLIQSIVWDKNTKKKMMDKVEHLIEFVGLKEVAMEKAENVSYPEQKLIILARALATEAKLLLLDEPTSGLDQNCITKMMLLFRRLVDEGRTVLLVEHNMDVVINISDYVIVLDFGQKIASGTPNEIRHNEKVIQAYLGVS